MRLWLQVALLIAAVSVAALMLTGLVAARVSGQSATAMALRAQERDAAAIADSVERWTKDQTSFLAGWARPFPLEDYDAPRRTGLLRAVLLAMPSARTVALVDGDGVAVVEPVFFDPEVVPAGRLAGTLEAAEAFVGRLPLTEALSSGVAVGDPYLQFGVPSIPVAVVASEDPPLLLAADVTLEIVAELEAQTSDLHAVVLADAHGNALTSEDHPLANLDLLRPLLGAHASVEYTAGGTGVRGAVAPVEGVGWSVFVLEPESVALEGARRIQRLLAPVVGVAMLLAVLFGLVLGRTVTEPIARLRDSALALAEGRYGSRADITRSDEVGELARAFNHMSVRLLDNQKEIQTQRDAIESFNRELQGRVDAATMELREAQAQLVRSGQLAAVAQIGAGLAHELNNPLMAILGLAQVLRMESHGGGLDGTLQDLEIQAERCREVVDAMLRVSSGEHLEIRGRSDIVAILEAVEAQVRPGFAQRGVELRVQAIRSAWVGLDEAVAVRVFGQLLTALAAGLPEGSSLTASASEEGGDVVVQLIPDREVGLDHDDWMASGLDVWVARQTLDRLGAQLVEPVEGGTAWRVRMPSAEA